MMALAFVTGAVASGFTAASLTALLIWIAALIAGSTDPWSIAPWLVSAVAALVALSTYLAEGIAYRRTLARMRSAGEPCIATNGLVVGTQGLANPLLD